MPHHPTKLRLRARRKRLGERVLVDGVVEPDLDQLVVHERSVDRRKHAGAKASVPNLDDRAKRVSLRSQEAALEAPQAGRRVGHRGEKASRRTWRGLVILALASTLSSLIACATAETPPQPLAELPLPRFAAPPAARLPIPIPEVTTAEPAPLLDQAPPESASLLYARSVLDARAAGLDSAQREGVARALALAEAEHGLPILLMLALIEQESRFDPHARGHGNSLGLMQVLPFVGADVAQRNGLTWQSDRTLLDPVQNVRIGTAYLGELRRMFGSTDHALAAYNMGPGNLRRLLARRTFTPGPYLTRVHARAGALKSEFGEPELAIGG